MRKLLLARLLVIAFAAVVQLSCGGGNTTMSVSPNAGSGSLTIFGGDAPLCNVVSYNVTITGATLTPQGGGALVSVLSSGQSVTVDFAALMDFQTVLNFANVPAGTYSQITLTLANSQLTVLDVTKSPPAPVSIPTTLGTSTVTVDISPALNVANAGAAGLEVDFKLLKSVQTDAQGQVTGTVNPVFQASPATPSSEHGLGELDDLKGLVQSVTTSSTNPSFTGSFTLQTRGGGGPTLTVNVTSTTEFEGVSGLSALAAGTFVEVEAFVDSSGNVVAKKVEVEEQENAEQKRAAFVGLVLSVTRDANGNATQFSMFVREHHPDMSNVVPLNSSLVVNIAHDTRFKTAAEGVNRAHLKFDPTTLGAGQSVVVHGEFQPGTPPSLNARAVFLRLQSILGNFSKLLNAGSDGKTGGFNLVPCSSIFQGQPISVLTFSQTAFAGVADLNHLTPQPTLVVKGLIFFAPQPVSVNGVTLTPPATVDVAKQVHQLQ